jgi:hypothetical protein
LTEQSQARGFQPAEVCRHPAVGVFPTGVKRGDGSFRDLGAFCFAKSRHQRTRERIDGELLFRARGEVEIYQAEAPQPLGRAKRFCDGSRFSGGRKDLSRDRDGKQGRRPELLGLLRGQHVFEGRQRHVGEEIGRCV